MKKLKSFATLVANHTAKIFGKISIVFPKWEILMHIVPVSIFISGKVIYPILSILGILAALPQIEYFLPISPIKIQRIILGLFCFCVSALFFRFLSFEIYRKKWSHLAPEPDVDKNLMEFQADILSRLCNSNLNCNKIAVNALNKITRKPRTRKLLINKKITEYKEVFRYLQASCNFTSPTARLSIFAFFAAGAVLTLPIIYNRLKPGVLYIVRGKAIREVDPNIPVFEELGSFVPANTREMKYRINHEFTDPDYSAFEIHEEWKTCDLRWWKPISDSSKEKSPATYTKVLRLKKTAETHEFRHQTSTTGGGMNFSVKDYDFIIEERAPTPTATGRMQSTYHVVIDISKIPLQTEFELIINASSWNGYSSPDQFNDSIKVKFPVKKSHLSVIFPERWEIINVVPLSGDFLDKSDPAYRSSAGFLFDERKNVASWSIDNPIVGWVYVISWQAKIS